MISTTAYCKVHYAVHEVVTFTREHGAIKQTETPAAIVRAMMDCGHTASLVMSEANLTAVTARKAGV